MAIKQTSANKTLADLVQDYGATGVVVADDGNGCGKGIDGVMVEYDPDMADAYGAVKMEPLEMPHLSEDEVECNYASDWMIIGEGDNPYRIRLYF